MKSLLTPLLALLAACGTPDPAAQHLGGIGDPVRGAALNAPSLLSDTSAYRGRPAAAARAAVQLEVLAQAFLSDPSWSTQASGATQHAMRQGREELRRAIGIAPDAPPEAVIEALRAAAAALDSGSAGRAQAALSGPDFPLGGADSLRRLGNLPDLPRVTEAAGAANSEIRARDRSGTRGG